MLDKVPVAKEQNIKVQAQTLDDGIGRDNLANDLVSSY